jgi:hypothetical protein
MVRRTRTDTVATRTPPEVLERFFRDVELSGPIVGATFRF